MFNRIPEFADKLIDWAVRVNQIGKFPQETREKFLSEVDGLFIDGAIKDDLRNKLNATILMRNNLADYTFRFNGKGESQGVQNIESYLNAIKDFFRVYFSYNKRKDAIVNKNILKFIVESGVKTNDNGETYIGLGNPMVLESLLICHFQIKDYIDYIEKLNASGRNKGSILELLYRQLIIGKIDRVFRDIILIYNERFLRIVGVDFKETNNEIYDIEFIAKEENALSSIEKISATRLIEKIISGLDVGKKYKILVVGEVMTKEYESTLCDLEKALSVLNYDIDITNLTRDDGDKFTAVFTPTGIDSCIKTYDKIFILDCPEIYYPISLDDKDDVDRVMRRSCDGIVDILSRDRITGERDFFNKNGFAAIYYRVQNYLLDMSRYNTKKTRKINTEFLDYLKAKLPYSEKDIGKELYVYLSNNNDFKDDLYDRYNFVRVERYNSKDCRIIKYPEPALPSRDRILSDKMELHLTLYKILKMLSPSRVFCNKLLGMGEDFLDTYDIARKVHIFLQYSPVRKSKSNLTIDINIKIQYPEEATNRVKAVTETLVREMFAFDCSSDDEPLNRILLYCYVKAIANVFNGCVDNFNDCLFHHFYMSKLMNCYKGARCIDVDFIIKNIDTYVCDNIRVEENVTPQFQYSVKRVAYEMMNKLDATYCEDSDIIKQILNVRQNQESVNMYIAGLKTACENFDYTDSKLFLRVSKRL